MRNTPGTACYAADDELYICQFGEERCRPRHGFGPAQRDHYLIHFVVSGRGALYSGGQSWPVEAGQGFLILPGEETYYEADARDPWHYAWVGCRGAQAEKLTRMAGLDARLRVFTVQDAEAVWQVLTSMRQEARALRLSQLAAAGGLLRFLALIAPVQDPHMVVPSGRACCDKALWYMEGRYDRPISIQETADFVGLSRSQLYRVMMAECGCSPKEMLLRIRMRHAEQLLTDTSLTLEEIAHRIGLQTGAQLGAAFKAARGVTPGAYRQKRKSKEGNA
ncbi:MAG: AraC family transcriptional regulator [Clostridia bacterium]|nr:AraC family transcriptional regulator [Clostridia bacterium]